MARLNTEFMDDTMGFQSKAEDELELAVCSALEKGGDFPDKIQNREVYEQLSEERHEVLRWYPFKPDASILEIGAGMGALTGVLAEKAKDVTCLEKKQSRCRILEKRFKNYEKIHVCNVNYADFVPEEAFDYVVIHDVTGYAKKYFKDESAHVSFFAKLKSFLKPSGVLLVLTENRLGIKYFSGAYEEYSGKFFTGLNNFDGYNYIKTFTKNELIYMGEKAGFKHCRFYYPYPDLSFPVQIYTDKILEKVYYGAHEAPYAKDRFVFFDEQRMFATLQKESVIDKFVNAFIAEFSLEELKESVFYYRVIDSHTGRRKYELMESLPAGIRADCYLIDMLEQLADGMAENRKEKTETLFAFLVKCVNMVSDEKQLYSIQDIYVDRDDVYLNVQNGIVADGYETFKACYFLYDLYRFYIRGRQDYERWLPFHQLCKKCGISREQMQRFFDVQKRNANERESHYGRKYYGNLIYPIDIYKNGDLIMEDFPARVDEEEELLMREEQLLETMGEGK